MHRKQLDFFRVVKTFLIQEASLILKQLVERPRHITLSRGQLTKHMAKDRRATSTGWNSAVQLHRKEKRPEFGFCLSSLRRQMVWKWINCSLWTTTVEQRWGLTSFQPRAMLFWDPFPGVSTSTHPLASGDLNSSHNKVKWNVPSDVKAKTIFLTVILILTWLTVGQQFTWPPPRGQIPTLAVAQKVEQVFCKLEGS